MSSNPPPPTPSDGGGKNNGWNQYYQNSAQQKPGSYSSPFVPAASQASASDPQSSYYYGAAGGSAGVNPYGRAHASNPYAGVYAAPAASYAQPSQNPYYAQASYSSSPINYASSGPAHQSSSSAYTSPWHVSSNRPVQHAASSNVANYWASMGYPSGSQPQVQTQVQSQGQSQGHFQSASAVSSNMAPWKSAGQSKMSFAEIVKQKSQKEIQKNLSKAANRPISYLSTKTASVTPPPIPVPAKAKKISPIEWPASLTKYVERSFERYLDNEDKQIVQEKLDNLIKNFTEKGTINSVDWDNFPLPTARSKPSTPISASKRLKLNDDAVGKNLKQKIRYISSSSDESEGSKNPIPKKKLNMRKNLANNDAEERKREERAMRFKKEKDEFEALKRNRRQQAHVYVPPVNNPDVIDWDEDTIVGTSSVIEKKYLRLTSAPDPNTVRPLPILKKTLQFLKKKWKEESDYNYICDQFKSLRQDLTVQRIKNEFTVQVYEIHARIALEKGDLGEYNQCQTQLKQLYAYNIAGNRMEFLAYRLLYLIHTKNRSEINAYMGELTQEEKENEAVKHALSVRQAVALSDYYLLFKLYLDAPAMGAYLMDHFITRERISALKTICKSYRPTIPVSFIKTTLAFLTMNECMEFLREQDILIDEANATIDCKLSYPNVIEKFSSLGIVDIKGQL